MRTSQILVTLVGAGLSLAAFGCAPVGQGDPCTPEAIPGNGFLAEEVYVETSSVQCRTRVCMVYHLKGNPECTMGLDSRCLDPVSETNPCVISNGAGGTTNLCVAVDDPAQVTTDAVSPDRVFCTCRCSASGNAALPLCQCTQGFRCVPETDPGGGYCVPDALALAAGVCASDEECASMGTSLSACDATHHCH